MSAKKNNISKMKKQELLDCPICCEKETKSLRRMIKCNYCNTSICKQCVCRYLLQTKQSPHCMQCLHEWNPNFVSKIGTLNFFHKEIREHLAKNFLEQEKLKLPETQPDVEKELQIRKIAKEIRELYKKSYDIKIKIQSTVKDRKKRISSRCCLKDKIKSSNRNYSVCRLNTCFNHFGNKDTTCHGKPLITPEQFKKDNLEKQYLDHIKNYTNEIKTFNVIINELKKENEIIRNQIVIKHHERNNLFGQPINRKRKFIKACPKENCKGFLSTGWKCGICSTTFCKYCHEEKKDDHVCDEDTKKTIELLAKDTRPCPSCGTGIFKIDGCDQMWCVDCKTAFSWKTGQVEKGIIHNPHYYQWMRNTNNGNVPRNPLDVPNNFDPCAGVVDAYRLRYAFKMLNVRHHKDDDFGILTSFTRIRNHTNYLLERYYTINLDYDKQLRIRYLLNELDENEWLNILRKELKNREYITEIRQILSMYANTINELLLEVLQHKNKKNTINELLKLTDYSRNHLDNIAKLYKRVPFRLNHYDNKRINI